MLITTGKFQPPSDFDFSLLDDTQLYIASNDDVINTDSKSNVEQTAAVQTVIEDQVSLLVLKYMANEIYSAASCAPSPADLKKPCTKACY